MQGNAFVVEVAQLELKVQASGLRGLSTVLEDHRRRIAYENKPFAIRPMMSAESGRSSLSTTGTGVRRSLPVKTKLQVQLFGSSCIAVMGNEEWRGIAGLRQQPV